MIKKILVNIPDDFEVPEKATESGYDDDNKCLECRFRATDEDGDWGWCVLTDEDKCPFYGDEDSFMCDIRIG